MNSYSTASILLIEATIHSLKDLDLSSKPLNSDKYKFILLGSEQCIDFFL